MQRFDSLDPATGTFVEGGIKEQTRQSLSNVQAILHDAKDYIFYFGGRLWKWRVR